MRWLDLDLVKKFEPMAAARGVSEVARSARGFLTAFKKAGGDPDSLSAEWREKRDNFLARHYEQMKDEEYFEEDGTPTRRHLALIMWAGSPSSDAQLKKALKPGVSEMFLSEVFALRGKILTKEPREDSADAEEVFADWDEVEEYMEGNGFRAKAIKYGDKWQMVNESFPGDGATSDHLREIMDLVTEMDMDEGGTVADLGRGTVRPVGQITDPQFDAMYFVNVINDIEDES